MIYFWFFLLLIERFIYSFATTNEPIVNTPLGAIRGFYSGESIKGRVYEFRSIPYAKAPIGNLKFKPPVPIKPWKGVRDACDSADRDCCQSGKVERLRTCGGFQDCLSLNILTHLIAENNELRPVLVYIHGGDLIYFTGKSKADAGHITAFDIVFVEVNYRLGFFGFYSTGDKHAPGNYGLKDQVLALKWVKNNIKFFGGDPTKVTLVGDGFGAASIGLHLLSPMSRGLFHGAIMISGSPTNFWSINKDPAKLAKRQAEINGCPINSSEDMVKCLRELDHDQGLSSLNNRMDWVHLYPNSISYLSRRYELNMAGRDTNNLRWYERYPLNAPVIEPENEGSERFLTKEPLESILEGDIADVPIFIGTTRNEMIHEACELERGMSELSRNWNTIAPILLQYKKNDTNSKRIREYYFRSSTEEIVFKRDSKKCDRLCRILYLTDVENFQNSMQVFNNLMSDRYFNFGIIRFAKLVAEKNKKPVYLYQFNYPGKNGANHLSHQVELRYVFHLHSESECMGHALDELHDTAFLYKYFKLWINFVKTGNPTPKVSKDFDNAIWKPYKNAHPAYLDINTTFTMKYGIPNKERMDLWETILPLPKRNSGV